MTEYEFTKEQNKTFRELARWMLILAFVVFLGGVATVIQWFLDLSTVLNLTSMLLLANGLMYIVLAVTVYFPVDNLKRIVLTEGSDIKELMVAFSELDKGLLIANIAMGLSRLVILLILIVAILGML